MAKFRINIGKWVEYWADASLETPENDRQYQGWTISTNGAMAGSIGVIACTSGSVPNGYSLQIKSSSSGTAMGYFEQSSGTAPWFIDVLNSRGYTIEAQLKPVAVGATQTQNIFFDDGVYSDRLNIWTTNARWTTAGYVPTYAFAAGQFRKFRITVKGNEKKLYVDDTLAIAAGTLAGTSSAKRIRFGDDSIVANYGGETRWAYFRYRTDGAYAPNGAPADGWTYAKFDIADKRRMAKYNIIRSNNTEIPEGKMQPAKVSVGGSVSGSDWSSFRSAVRRLKRIFAGGTQRIYVENSKYIEGLHTGFKLRPQTQDYADYSASFDCRFPYWQNNYASYVSTAPATTSTFYLTNNGDVEVPLKIIMTGAQASTITDDIEFANATTKQRGKYVGILAQSTELTIDKGFEFYNDYRVLVATASSFGSYEGDLFTLTPGVNDVVFTGGAVGTIEFYWREAHLL